MPVPQPVTTHRQHGSSPDHCPLPHAPCALFPGPSGPVVRVSLIYMGNAPPNAWRPEHTNQIRYSDALAATRPHSRMIRLRCVDCCCCSPCALPRLCLPVWVPRGVPTCTVQEWPFNHGAIDRTEAERRIIAHNVVGAYLVNTSASRGRCTAARALHAQISSPPANHTFCPFFARKDTHFVFSLDLVRACCVLGQQPYTRY